MGWSDNNTVVGWVGNSGCVCGWVGGTYLLLLGEPGHRRIPLLDQSTDLFDWGGWVGG